MSAKSLSLKSPVLIAVVVVMGVAVTVLNVRTFGGARHAGRPQAARAQAGAALPGDLDDLVRGAGRDLRGDAGSHVPGSIAYQRPGRDPFTGPEGVPPDVTSIDAVPTDNAGRDHGDLVCTAVLPGGKRPLAVIDGKTRTLGESFDGWTLAGISAGGVVLRNTTGKERRLPVTRSASAGTYSVSVGGAAVPSKGEQERMEP